MSPIPYATAIPDPVSLIPAAVPVDAAGKVLIPELVARAPTHNESILISGDTITMGSTNVAEIWWNWRLPDLFVKFLNGSLYVYHQLPLLIAVGMVETASPGRFVWSVLRVGWPTSTGAAQCLIKGPSRAGKGRPRAQVIRIVR